MQPVAGGGVWALSGSKVLASSDGGTTWRNVTPAGVKFGVVSSFCALDANDAWLATVTASDQYGEPAQIGVWRTWSGGQSWDLIATVPDPEEAYPDVLQFVDPEHGWLLMGLVGMAQSAVLLGTDDGGLSWTQEAGQSAPTYLGDLDFTSDDQGWLAFPGAAGGGTGVYRTRDGGQMWAAVAQPLLQPVGPAGDECTALDGFRFLTAEIGIAATDDRGCGVGNDELTVWVTSDEGASWQSTVPLVAFPGDLSPCGFDALSSTVWVEVVCESNDYSPAAVDWTLDGGADWVTLTAQGLPAGPWAVAFVNSRDGFAASAFSPTELYSTTDSGQTWQPIALSAA